MVAIYLHIKIIVIIVILIPRCTFIVSKDILKICNQINQLNNGNSEIDIFNLHDKLQVAL